jgi:hypothetical protein
MSDLHLRINWALALAAAEAAREPTGPPADGPDTEEEHPVFLAAADHPARRARAGVWDPSARFTFPEFPGDDDPGPEDCA